MSVIDDIRAQLDVVEVVQSYVPELRQSGKTWKANCPFHTERTPSFVVSPERQSWRCFGACATGGDIFGFVMRSENMEFGDALRTLARRAGVELQPERDRQETDAVESVNNAAVEFYQQTLEGDAGAIGREYLDGRGVSGKARADFKLGLSPNSWDGLCQYLRIHQFKREDAVRAGLVRETDDGRPYDFFRNRLMFPISDRNGKVIGFGARALDDSNPKYINTAATEVFDKRNTLYALDKAIGEIRSSRTAVIVEGYMDAIAAHENGFKNVVASMGTALTENQVSQLRSLADDFTLALDPDAAGQEATLRSLESSWRVFRGVTARRGAASQSVLSDWKPPTLKIAELPEGLDPDALIRQDSERWRTTVQNAQPLLDFAIPALVKRTDLSVADNRARIAREIARLINVLDQADQYEYWEKLANALGTPLDALRAAISAPSASSRRRRRGRGGDWRDEDDGAEIEVSANLLAGGTSDPVEDYALAILIRHPHLLDETRGCDPEIFSLTENRQLFTNLTTYPTIEELKIRLDPSLAAQFARLEGLTEQTATATGPRTAQTALSECLRRLERKRLGERLESILQMPVGETPGWDVEGAVVEINRRIREIESMMAS